jgi:hypothetical protein
MIFWLKGLVILKIYELVKKFTVNLLKNNFELFLCQNAFYNVLFNIKLN